MCLEQSCWVNSRICIPTMDELINHDSYLFIKAFRDSLRNIAVPLTYGLVSSVFKIMPVIGCFFFLLIGTSCLLQSGGIHLPPPNLLAASARLHLFEKLPLPLSSC